MSVSSAEKSTRIFGFDILRIATLLAILYFHVWQFTFNEDIITLPAEISSYHNLTDWVGPVFKYGGLFIVALSFFLIGLKEKSRHLNRIYLLIVGIVGLQILSAEDPADPNTWNWDVFSYLVFSYFVVVLTTKKLPVRYGLIALSLIVLSIPYEIYESLLKIPETVQYTGWNILPWLALPVLYHSLGVVWREKVPGTVAKVPWWESLIWISLITTLYLVSPDAGSFPAGPGFEAYVFKPKPLLFGFHFSVFSFLMRLSLDPRVNGFLGQLAPIQWLSSLRWNQRFGLCYLLQFAFLPLGSLLMNFWATYPRAFEWLWLFIFIVVELIARVVLKRKGLFKLIDRL